MWLYPLAVGAGVALPLYVLLRLRRPPLPRRTVIAAALFAGIVLGGWALFAAWAGNGVVLYGEND